MALYSEPTRLSDTCVDDLPMPANHGELNGAMRDRNGASELAKSSWPIAIDADCLRTLSPSSVHFFDLGGVSWGVD